MSNTGIEGILDSLADKLVPLIADRLSQKQPNQNTEAALEAKKL